MKYNLLVNNRKLRNQRSLEINQVFLSRFVILIDEKMFHNTMLQ
jgi:hypothetical protein